MASPKRFGQKLKFGTCGIGILKGIKDYFFFHYQNHQNQETIYPLGILFTIPIPYNLFKLAKYDILVLTITFKKNKKK